MNRPLILSVFVFVIGCAAPFSRPTPTESEYKQRFLSHLEPDQIVALRFSYHGAVGGQASIARFSVDAGAVAQIRNKAQREEVYPSEDGVAVQELKHRFAGCAGSGRIPDWFDFPFGKSLTVFIDSGDYTADHPAYSHEWYVDEERGIVYFVMVEG